MEENKWKEAKEDFMDNMFIWNLREIWMDASVIGKICFPIFFPFWLLIAIIWTMLNLIPLVFLIFMKDNP